MELLEYYEVGEEVTMVVAVQDADGYTEKEVTITLGENPNKDAEVEEELEEVPEEEMEVPEGEEEEGMTEEDFYEYFFGNSGSDGSMPDIREFFGQR